MFCQSGYWNPGSEPEMECKDNLSSSTDATFESNLYFCKEYLQRNWLWAGNWFNVNPSWCEGGSEEQEDDSSKTTQGANRL